MGYTGDKKRKYQLKWIKSRRRKWIDANGPCRKCGGSEGLEVDHVNPENKKFHVAGLWSRAKHIMDKELKKCQVLCHSCHRKKSNLEISKRHPLIHGTHNAYVRGCRCDDCRIAHNASTTAWKRARRGKE